jgi:hypothetical protein
MIKKPHPRNRQERQKTTGQAQNLVDPSQLLVLPPELPDDLTLLRAGPVGALTPVGLIPTDPVPQSLSTHTQLAGHRRDRGPRLRLPVQTHTVHQHRRSGTNPRYRRCAVLRPRPGARKRRPPKTNSSGRLLEWWEDLPDEDPGHRHLSHLYGLYPGSAIDPLLHPALVLPARLALEHRLEHGGGATGGSLA